MTPTATPCTSKLPVPSSLHVTHSTSLPPAVKGPIQARVIVCVDKIVWHIRDPPRRFAVCLTWWGDSQPPTRFVPPVVQSKSEGKGNTKTRKSLRGAKAIFPVRCGRTQLLQYLSDMGWIGFDIVDDIKRMVLGRAELKAPAQLDRKCSERWCPVMTADMHKIAEVRISISLQTSIESSKSPKKIVGKKESNIPIYPEKAPQHPLQRSIDPFQSPMPKEKISTDRRKKKQVTFADSITPFASADHNDLYHGAVVAPLVSTTQGIESIDILENDDTVKACDVAVKHENIYTEDASMSNLLEAQSPSSETMNNQERAMTSKHADVQDHHRQNIFGTVSSNGIQLQNMESGYYRSSLPDVDEDDLISRLIESSERLQQDISKLNDDLIASTESTTARYTKPSLSSNQPCLHVTGPTFRASDELGELIGIGGNSETSIDIDDDDDFLGDLCYIDEQDDSIEDQRQQGPHDDRSYTSRSAFEENITLQSKSRRKEGGIEGKSQSVRDGTSDKVEVVFRSTTLNHDRRVDNISPQSKYTKHRPYHQDIEHHDERTKSHPGDVAGMLHRSNENTVDQQSFSEKEISQIQQMRSDTPLCETDKTKDCTDCNPASNSIDVNHLPLNRLVRILETNRAIIQPHDLNLTTNDAIFEDGDPVILELNIPLQPADAAGKTLELVRLEGYVQGKHVLFESNAAIPLAFSDAVVSCWLRAIVVVRVLFRSRCIQQGHLPLLNENSMRTFSSSNNFQTIGLASFPLHTVFHESELHHVYMLPVTSLLSIDASKQPSEKLSPAVNTQSSKPLGNLSLSIRLTTIVEDAASPSILPLSQNIKDSDCVHRTNRASTSNATKVLKEGNQNSEQSNNDPSDRLCSKQYPSEDTDVSSLPVYHMMLSVQNARGFSVRKVNMNPRNLYLITRLPNDSSVQQSNVIWNTCTPTFLHQHSIFRLRTQQFLENLRNGLCIVEVWDRCGKPDGDDLFLGLVKIPTKCFYDCFSDSAVARAVLQAEYPVFAANNYQQVIDHISGRIVGQLRVVLAMGSSRQMMLITRSDAHISTNDNMQHSDINSEQKGLAETILSAETEPNGFNQYTRRPFSVIKLETKGPRIDHLPRSTENIHKVETTQQNNTGGYLAYKHTLSIEVPRALDLDLFESSLYGETDCFIECDGLYQPDDKTDRLLIKRERSRPVLCVPNPELQHKATYSFITTTFEDAIPFMREALPGGLRFGLYQRSYYPNIADNLQARSSLSISRISELIECIHASGKKTNHLHSKSEVPVTNSDVVSKESQPQYRNHHSPFDGAEPSGHANAVDSDVHMTRCAGHQQWILPLLPIASSDNDAIKPVGQFVLILRYTCEPFAFETLISQKHKSYSSTFRDGQILEENKSPLHYPTITIHLMRITGLQAAVEYALSCRVLHTLEVCQETGINTVVRIALAYGSPLEHNHTRSNRFGSFDNGNANYAFANGVQTRTKELSESHESGRCTDWYETKPHHRSFCPEFDDYAQFTADLRSSYVVVVEIWHRTEERQSTMPADIRIIPQASQRNDQYFSSSSSSVVRGDLLLAVARFPLCIPYCEETNVHFGDGPSSIENNIYPMHFWVPLLAAGRNSTRSSTTIKTQPSSDVHPSWHVVGAVELEISVDAHESRTRRSNGIDSYNDGKTSKEADSKIFYLNRAFPLIQSQLCQFQLIVEDVYLPSSYLGTNLSSTVPQCEYKFFAKYLLPDGRVQMTESRLPDTNLSSLPIVSLQHRGVYTFPLTSSVIMALHRQLEVQLWRQKLMTDVTQNTESHLIGNKDEEWMGSVFLTVYSLLYGNASISRLCPVIRPHANHFFNARMRIHVIFDILPNPVQDQNRMDRKQQTVQPAAPAGDMHDITSAKPAATTIHNEDTSINPSQFGESYTSITRNGGTCAMMVTIHRAVHLPTMLTDRFEQSKTLSEKSTLYVSYRTSDEIVCTQMCPVNDDAVWNHTRTVNVYVPTVTGQHEQFAHCALTFQIWSHIDHDFENPSTKNTKDHNHVNVSESQESQSNDRSIGRASVSLEPLIFGMSQLDGWYHIMSAAGDSVGQLHVTIEPLQAFRENCNTTQSPCLAANRTKLANYHSPSFQNSRCDYSREAYKTSFVRTKSPPADVSRSFLHTKLQENLSALESLSQHLHQRLQSHTAVMGESFSREHVSLEDFRLKQQTPQTRQPPDFEQDEQFQTATLPTGYQQQESYDKALLGCHPNLPSNVKNTTPNIEYIQHNHLTFLSNPDDEHGLKFQQTANHPVLNSCERQFSENKEDDLQNDTQTVNDQLQVNAGQNQENKLHLQEETEVVGQHVSAAQANAFTEIPVQQQAGNGSCNSGGSTGFILKDQGENVYNDLKEFDDFGTNCVLRRAKRLLEKIDGAQTQQQVLSRIQSTRDLDSARHSVGLIAPEVEHKQVQQEHIHKVERYEEAQPQNLTQNQCSPQQLHVSGVSKTCQDSSNNIVLHSASEAKVDHKTMKRDFSLGFNFEDDSDVISDVEQGHDHSHTEFFHGDIHPVEKSASITHTDLPNYEQHDKKSSEQSIQQPHCCSLPDEYNQYQSEADQTTSQLTQDSCEKEKLTSSQHNGCVADITPLPSHHHILHKEGVSALTASDLPSLSDCTPLHDNSSRNNSYLRESHHKVCSATYLPRNRLPPSSSVSSSSPSGSKKPTQTNTSLSSFPDLSTEEVRRLEAIFKSRAVL